MKRKVLRKLKDVKRERRKQIKPRKLKFSKLWAV